MAMSKESAIGFILMAVFVGMLILCKQLGIDGEVQSTLMGVIGLVWLVLGGKGYSAAVKEIEARKAVSVTLKANTNDKGEEDRDV